MSTFLPKFLGGILVLVSLAIVVVAGCLLLGSPSAADASRLLSVTTALLVPVFQGILTALVTAGIIKGVLVALNNPQLEQTKRQKIEFFDW